MVRYKCLNFLIKKVCITNCCMTDVLQMKIRILVQSLLWCCFSLLIFKPCTTAVPSDIDFTLIN